MIINTLEQLLTLDEGKRLKPYQDSRGIWTIGIGHNLQANVLPAGLLPPEVPTTYSGCMDHLNANGLTENQCDQLFEHDIVAVAGFLRIFPGFAAVDLVRQKALQDMAFNLGEDAFRGFGMFNSLWGTGRWADAAADLRRTKVYAELTKRYERLARMLETGQWPVVA